MNHRRKLIEVALPLEVIKGPGAGAVPFAKTSISSSNRKMLLHQRRREDTYVCPPNEFVDLQVLLEGGIRLIKLCYPGLVQRASNEWLFEVSA